MSEFRMPSLGADMEAGTIVEWRVQPGDTVHRGDIVAVIDTEKATIDVEVFEDGIIEELLIQPGREVPVGTPLARLRSLDAAAAPTTAAAPSERTSSEAPTFAAAPTSAGAPTSSSAEHGVAPASHLTRSPLVRKLAAAEHVDLAAVAGSGPGGTVTRHDVEAAAHHEAPVPAGDREPHVGRTDRTDRVPASPLARRRAAADGIDLRSVAGTGPAGAVVAADLAGQVRRADAAPPPPSPPAPSRAATPDTRRALLRASLGTLMSRSKREIPHYYLANTIDLHAAVDWLTQVNEARPITERIVPAALLLRATTLACQDVPALNGHWTDGAFQGSDAVHLGVAISLRGGGLIAPALRDAQDLTLDELMRRLRDLVTRARAGSLRSSEMTDPSITITNLGDQGVEEVFGVIYPPQVALVGFGKIVDRPWAEQQMLTVRPVIRATLSADHRASDGHDGARFLSAIARYLQEPELL